MSPQWRSASRISKKQLTDRASTGATTLRPRRSPTSTDRGKLPTEVSDEEEAEEKAGAAGDFLKNFVEVIARLFCKQMHQPQKTAAVASWIEKLKIPKTKANKVDDLAKEVMKAYNAMEPADRGEDIPGLAVDWGMPIKLASSLDTVTLVKVIAAAAVMSK